MRCRTMLLGGAVALALSGAAYAQAQQASPPATPGTDQINAGSAVGTQATGQGTMSNTTTTKSSTHHRHHYRHHVHHHMKTASSLHHPSTPAERQATQNLNQQQMQGGSMQNTAQPAGSNMNMQQPGNAGYTQPQGAQPQGTQPQGTQPQGTQPQGTMENQPSN